MGERLKSYLRNGKRLVAIVLALFLFSGIFLSYKVEAYAMQDASYWGRFSSNYYYNNMNDTEKQLYDALYARCMSLLTSNETINGNIGQIPCGLSAEEAMNICFIFSCSNPQFYFLNDNYSAGYSPNIGDFCSIGVYSEFCDGYSRENSSNTFISSLADVFSQIDAISTGSESLTQYNREKYIYNYICDSVEYVSGVQRSQSCYSAAVDKQSVCAGYAEEFELLCRYAGINCIVVTSSNHEWNEVQINGKWYAVDATWGDASYSRDDCFNKATVNLSNTHTAEDSWMNYGIPICDQDYDTSPYLQSAGIYVVQQSNEGILCGMVTEGQNLVNLQYRWLGYSYDTGLWFVISDWTLNNEWLRWNPGTYGDYLVRCEVSTVENQDRVLNDNIGMNHHPGIKGICQTINPGGGYLIGMESYKNISSACTYELLIYDCTLNKWVYSTGRSYGGDNSYWTIWNPQYGYYWTLYRIYDSNGNIFDQKCYGFANI